MLSFYIVSTFGWVCISCLDVAFAQSYTTPPTFLGQVSRPIVPYTFRPTHVHSVIGAVNRADALVQSSGPSERNGSFPSATLSPNSSVILDFSLDVGGYPVFDVAASTLDGSATLRYTVSESLSGLKAGAGDGAPFKGHAGARYRYEVIPVSGGGERWIGRAIQGGQRFLLIEHIAGTANVVIKDVGFEAATDITPVENLPGGFNSSDRFLNELWAAGARTVQLGCASKGSLAPAWHVSAIGTLIESQNLAIYEKSGAWQQIDFSLFPCTSSTVRLLRSARGARADGNSTFSGYSGASVDLPAGVLTTGKWHDLRFSVRGDNNATMSVAIDGVDVGSISYDPKITSTGPLGFSVGDGTTVIIKDLLVQDVTGNILYSNSLTSMSALADFATGINHYSACLDGAKRDRVVWSGDFSIFGPTIFYSTANVDAVAGSLLLFTGVQYSSGQLATAVSASLNPSEFPTDDYAISSVNAWYEWYQYTGDISFLAKWWPAIKRDLEYGLSFLDGTSGLINIGALLAMNFNYYDAPCPGTHISANAILVWGLRNAALMADSLGDSTASMYRTTASKIEDAVNRHLFSGDQGAYVLTDDENIVGISQDGNAYAILAGIASAPSAPSSAKSVIKSMQSLNTPFGPLSFSNTTRFLPIVSPYASGLHTWAAFEAGMTEEAIDLMRAVWKNQTDVNNPWYTGMTWEFINGTSGEPYRPWASSQAHGWGSGPTWQLSRYVLGIAPVTPGYSTWSFAPQTANLTFANGRVPTPWGTIVASWEDKGSAFNMHVTAPAGTNGTVTIPMAANKTVTVNGLNIRAGGLQTLPAGVSWAGINGRAYRLNVTSGGHKFDIYAS